MKKENNNSKGDRPSNNPKLGGSPFFGGRASVTQIGIAIFLVASVAFALYPHKTNTLHTSSKLQTGQKMEVELTVRSPWGWCEPDRISDMQVHLNDRELPVKTGAYFWIGPIDTIRGAIIAETRGFPEVVVWGKKGQSLSEVRWKFLNYYFSEREMIHDHKVEDTQYTAPGMVSGTMVAALTVPAVNTIIFTPGPVKSIALDFHPQVLVINADKVKKATKQEFKEWRK